jgi:chemotaxis protein MotA
MDFASVGGVLIAILAILGGQALEGGNIGSILQPTAAIIVFGGTIGAVCVQFPGHILRQAMSELRQVFKPAPIDVASAIKSIVTLAGKARRDGLVSIEREVSAIQDAFMRRGLELAVDGTDAKVLKNALEMELTHIEEESEGPAKVFEAAGGYAPTVGILGAVLGLIHVMENLSDPSKLGGGIAVAFVATVYGVGSANLFFLPMASKLKLRAREKLILMEIVIEGVCALAEGENPRLIERKLSVFAAEKQGEKGDAAAAKAAESAA